MFQQLPSLQFFVNNVAGVRLVDALNLPINGLHNAGSIPTLSATTNRVTLRILVSRSCLAVLICSLCLFSGLAILSGRLQMQSTPSTIPLRGTLVV